MLSVMGEGSLPAEVQAAVERGETLTPAQYADILLFQLRGDGVDAAAWTAAGPRVSEAVSGCREIVLSGPVAGQTVTLRRLFTADGSPHSREYFFRLAVHEDGRETASHGSDDATSALGRAVTGMVDAVTLGGGPVGSLAFVGQVVAHLERRFARDGLDGWEVAGPEPLRAGTGSLTRYISPAGLSTVVLSVERRLNHEDVAVHRCVLEIYREDILIGRRGSESPDSAVGRLAGRLEAALHTRVRALQDAATRELS